MNFITSDLSRDWKEDGYPFADPMTTYQVIMLVCGLVGLAVLAWLVYHQKHLK